MKILVIIRQVPDSTTAIKIRGDGEDIERGGVKMVVNPFDEFAVELAVQLRERGTPVAQITAAMIGPAAAAATLQPPLAVGADDAIHLQDSAFERLDEIQTAAVLAAVARGGGYDLTLIGKQEIDLDSGQTGPALAEFLDVPHVGACTKVEFAADGKSITARRRIEGAEEVVSMPLPAVITCEKGLPEMRYPSLPNLMKAKKKPVRVMTKSDIPGFDMIASQIGGSEIHKYEPPPQRPPGKVLKGDAAQTVPELVRLLRQEAKVI
jgi:electron transfer flavoprotein beta subunit